MVAAREAVVLAAEEVELPEPVTAPAAEGEAREAAQGVPVPAVVAADREEVDSGPDREAAGPVVGAAGAAAATSTRLKKLGSIICPRKIAPTGP